MPIDTGTALRPSDDVTEMVVVVDFGAQYTHLIARRIRECKVYCEVVPHDISMEALTAKVPRGIIFSGGPASVYSANAPRIDPAVYELGIPVLGICYGLQLMAYKLGGEVRSADQREYGRAELRILDPAP